MVYSRIILHAIKIKMRDYKMLFMMGVFPLLLAGMFGFVFEQAYGDIKIEGNIGIIITEGNTTLGEDYKAFLEQVVEEDMTLQYEVVDEQKEVEILKEKTKDVIVYIDEVKDQIYIKQIANNSLLKGALDNMHQSFAESVALRKVIEETMATGEVKELKEMKRDDVVTTVSLEGNATKDVVTSMIIAMFIFAILIGGQFGIEQVFYLNQAVGKRVYTAPVNKAGVYLSELFACWVTTFSVAVLAGCVFEYLFDLGLRNNTGATLFIVAVTALIATLIGTAMGMVSPSSATGENIYGFLQTGMVILSGGLVPGVDFGVLSYLSPVKGAIDGIEQIITEGKLQNVGEIFLSLAVVVIVVGIVIYSVKNKEGMKGAKYLRNSKA